MAFNFEFSKNVFPVSLGLFIPKDFGETFFSLFDKKSLIP